MVRVYKQGVDSPEMRERPGLKVKIVIYSVFINLEFYQILGNFLNFFFLFFSRNLWFFSFSHPFFTFYLYFTVFFYSRSIFFHIFWTFWSFFWSNLNFCVFLVVFWYLILNTAKLPIYTPHSSSKLLWCAFGGLFAFQGPLQWRCNFSWTFIWSYRTEWSNKIKWSEHINKV